MNILKILKENKKKILIIIIAITLFIVYLVIRNLNLAENFENGVDSVDSALTGTTTTLAPINTQTDTSLKYFMNKLNYYFGTANILPNPELPNTISSTNSEYEVNCTINILDEKKKRIIFDYLNQGNITFFLVRDNNVVAIKLLSKENTGVYNENRNSFEIKAFYKSLERLDNYQSSPIPTLLEGFPYDFYVNMNLILRVPVPNESYVTNFNKNMKINELEKYEINVISDITELKPIGYGRISEQNTNIELYIILNNTDLDKYQILYMFNEKLKILIIIANIKPEFNYAEIKIFNVETLSQYKPTNQISNNDNNTVSNYLFNNPSQDTNDFKIYESFPPMLFKNQDGFYITGNKNYNTIQYNIKNLQTNINLNVANLQKFTVKNNDNQTIIFDKLTNIGTASFIKKMNTLQLNNGEGEFILEFTGNSPIYPLLDDVDFLYISNETYNIFGILTLDKNNIMVDLNLYNLVKNTPETTTSSITFFKDILQTNLQFMLYKLKSGELFPNNLTEIPYNYSNQTTSTTVPMTTTTIPITTTTVPMTSTMPQTTLYNTYDAMQNNLLDYLKSINLSDEDKNLLITGGSNILASLLNQPPEKKIVKTPGTFLSQIDYDGSTNVYSPLLEFSKKERFENMYDNYRYNYSKY